VQFLDVGGNWNANGILFTEFSREDKPGNIGRWNMGIINKWINGKRRRELGMGRRDFLERGEEEINIRAAAAKFSVFTSRL